MAELITRLSEYRTRFDTCFATDFVDINIKIEALKHLCNGYGEILRQYLEGVTEKSELFVPSISMKFTSIGNEMHERLDSLIEKVKSGVIKATYTGGVKGSRHPDTETFRLMFTLLPAVPELTRNRKGRTPTVSPVNPDFDGPDPDEEKTKTPTRTIKVPTFKGGLQGRKDARKAQHQREKQLRKEAKRVKACADAEMYEALEELKATLDKNYLDSDTEDD